MLAEGRERKPSSREGIVLLMYALGANRSIGMSRVHASGSPHYLEDSEPGSGGLCAIISRAVGERHESRILSFPIRIMREQFESDMTVGLCGAVSSAAGSCRTLWTPKRAALMAESEE